MATPDRIADQIRNAVQDAVSSQDFSNLQSTIESSIDAAAKGIGRGVAQAQDAYRQAQQARVDERNRIVRENQMLAVYSKPNRVRDEGVVLTACGALLIVPSFPTFIASLTATTWTAPVVVGAFLLAGVGLLTAGIRNLGLAKRFARYRDYIGLRDYCEIEELARVTSDEPKNVVAAIKRMIKKHLFVQAALDRNEGTLIMNSDAYAQYLAAEEQYQRRLREQNLAETVTPVSHSDGDIPAEAAELIARGEAYVAKIRLSNEAIPGAEISRKIDQIESVVRHILKRAEEHPEVIGDLGQLMDYYLPMTVKLLDAYRDLDSQPIQGENILKSKREIEGALDSLAVAFEKLLDQVFRDVAWDVSSDVSVLHTVLAQEGLVEDPFSSKNRTR